MDVTIDVLDNIDTASTVDSHRTWPGRLIVMGHDFATNQPTMDQVLGNAVLLPPAEPVVVVPYEGAAASASVANANAAITQSALSAGRSIQWLGAVSADSLPSQLPIADVLLIYGQENATDTDLAQWAEQWKDALTIFVQTGGTIVLLDGYYGANVGTCQILDLTGLLAVVRRYGATGNVCDVVAPTDPLVTGLPPAYLCAKNSVQYRLSESGSNVTSVVASGDPVVVDKTF